MTKDKDIKTVAPALRFPEFRDTEGWEETTLGEIAKFYKGKGISKSDIAVNGHLPCIRYGELYTHYNEIINSIISYTGLLSDDLVLSQINDVIIPASGETKEDIATASCVMMDNVALGGDLNIIRSRMNGIFLSFYLNNAKKYEISQLAQGYSVVHLYAEQLKKLQICIPKLKEQTKIAECLGGLDDLISAVSDKIETLKEYKKGLMQQLFPSKGKTTPSLRFPEFQNTGEWRETTLREEVYYENGKAHENDIDEAGQYIVVNSKFISTDGEVVKYTDNPSCLAEKGDILMVLSDVPNGRAIAKCFIVDSDNKYTVNQRICKLKSKKNIGLLLYYIINRNPFLLAFDDGIKQTNLKKDDVLNCPFRLPKEPKEQQRIADSLSSVDDLISAEADKLGQLKAHKKGLMQQLFPTINKL